MAQPERAVAYTFDFQLVDKANRPSFKANPTLASGDFKVSKDNGPLNNLATLPVVSPAGSVIVKVALSASEMDADRVTVVAIDASQDEWDDVVQTIQTGPRLTVAGVCAGGATTTSIPTSSLTPSAVVQDQFKGRVVIFSADTATAALRGQATDITANSNTGVLTVSALTSAPAAGDVFTIV